MKPKRDGLEDFVKISGATRTNVSSLLTDYCKVLDGELCASDAAIVQRTYRTCQTFIGEARSRGQELGGLVATLNVCNLWAIVRNNRVRRRTENSGGDVCSVACAIILRYALDHLIVMTDRFFIQAPSNRVLIPATAGTAVYKLLRHVRAKSYTYSKVLGVDRAAILRTGKNVVDHLLALFKDGAVKSKFKAYCQWVFTYPNLDDMFQCMVSSKTGKLTDNFMEVKSLIKGLPRASYASHACLRGHTSTILPLCLLRQNSDKSAGAVAFDMTPVDEHDQITNVPFLKERDREMLKNPRSCSESPFHNCDDSCDDEDDVSVPVRLRGSRPATIVIDTSTSGSSEDSSSEDDDSSCTGPETTGVCFGNSGHATVHTPTKEEASYRHISHSAGLRSHRTSRLQAEKVVTEARCRHHNIIARNNGKSVKQNKSKEVKRLKTSTRTIGALGNVRPFHPPGSPWANNDLKVSLLTQKAQLHPVVDESEKIDNMQEPSSNQEDMEITAVPEPTVPPESVDETERAVCALRELAEAAGHGNPSLDDGTSQHNTCQPPSGHLDVLSKVLETVPDEIPLSSPLPQDISEMLDTFLLDDCLLHSMHLATGLSIFDSYKLC
ncbi:ORF42 [callitrichine gammaherpesvirus 3]|uniref:ORF42 n=1 Tax=callitrichine gammaherpesvirus 3 TaxID=106331 RepID=Q993G8_9GAMA|nr:ORF42 [callitrichine gammaherpesvirus 3]AAK38250.1 ORF42 [callitrichine gammaherpesvirus 3]